MRWASMTSRASPSGTRWGRLISSSRAKLTVIPEFAPRRIPARLTLKASILSPKVAKLTPGLGLKYLEIDPKSASGGSQTTLILCHLGRKSKALLQMSHIWGLFTAVRAEFRPIFRVARPTSAARDSLSAGPETGFYNPAGAKKCPSSGPDDLKNGPKVLSDWCQKTLNQGP